jgi:hypothetical protein
LALPTFTTWYELETQRFGNWIYFRNILGFYGGEDEEICLDVSEERSAYIIRVIGIGKLETIA